MEFKEVVQRRRMVRNFSDKPVDDAVIERILDVARRGPSAGFTQGQDFVVVTDDSDKQAIAELCGEQYYVSRGFDPFISKAAALIVPCTSEAAYRRRYSEPDKGSTDEDEQVWPVPYWYMDGGCAVMLLLLAVVDEGLAAGFAGAHDLDKLRQLLSIPAKVTPLGVIPIGHPAPDKRSPSLKRGRRARRDVVHWQRWTQQNLDEED